jgi:hypothetical protein
MRTAVLSAITLSLAMLAGAAHAASTAPHAAAGRVMLNPQPLPPRTR